MFKGLKGMEKMIMQQAQRLQEQAVQAQQELEATRLEAGAGGGMVTAVVNGTGELLELKISPEVVNPEEVEMLQDLVLAAVREAVAKAKQLQSEKLGALGGGLLPGLGL